jgi:hypothetical protein
MDIRLIAKVIGRRDSISSLTLLPVENDIPNSKEAIFFIQPVYCSRSGLSSPYTSLSVFIDSSVIFGFSSPAAKKLFGAILTAIKEMAEMSSSIKKV